MTSSKNNDKDNQKLPILVSPVDPSLSGYMPVRNEFECEWDDGCEQLIMDIEFDDDDTKEEFEIKMELLELYNLRLSKRRSMRKLVVEKKLHDCQYQEAVKKSRTPQETKLHTKLKKFLQVLSVEEYEEFIQGLAKQQELEQKVRHLRAYRLSGLTSLQEIPDFKKRSKNKRRRELLLKSSPTTHTPLSASVTPPSLSLNSVSSPVQINSRVCRANRVIANTRKSMNPSPKQGVVAKSEGSTNYMAKRNFSTAADTPRGTFGHNAVVVAVI